MARQQQVRCFVAVLYVNGLKPQVITWSCGPQAQHVRNAIADNRPVRDGVERSRKDRWRGAMKDGYRVRRATITLD